MSHSASPSSSGDDGQAESNQSRRARSRFVRLALLPAVGLAVVVVAAAVLVACVPSGVIVPVGLVAAAALGAVIVVWAARSAIALANDTQRQRHELSQVAADLRVAADGDSRLIAELRRTVDADSEQIAELQRAIAGTRAWPAEFRGRLAPVLSSTRGSGRDAPDAPVDVRDVGQTTGWVLDDVWSELLALLDQVVLDVARSDSALAEPDRLLEVFAIFGRRQQSLVQRAIRLLDDLESMVEEPDLLKGLYGVDHLVTIARRQAENFVVLGGDPAPRQWTQPAPMMEVIRSAVAEIQEYNRVKLAIPINGTLNGHAVVDVTHLLAELIENATAFSKPETTVLVSTQDVTAGLVIEIEDRGIGIEPDRLHRLNQVLGGADSTTLNDFVRQGLVGLLVVSRLARRPGIELRLRTNIFGGITADVVVPRRLLGGESDSVAGTLSEPAPHRTTSSGEGGEPAGPAPPLPLPTSTPQSLGHQPVPAPAFDEPTGVLPAIVAAPRPWTDTMPPAEPVHYRWPGVETTPDNTVETSDPEGPERPILPKRRPGTTHMAKELLADDWGVTTPESPVDVPYLAAGFQRGFARGSGEVGRHYTPADDTHDTNADLAQGESSQS